MANEIYITCEGCERNNMGLSEHEPYSSPCNGGIKTKVTIKMIVDDEEDDSEERNMHMGWKHK